MHEAVLSPRGKWGHKTCALSQKEATASPRNSEQGSRDKEASSLQSSEAALLTCNFGSLISTPVGKAVLISTTLFVLSLGNKFTHFGSFLWNIELGALF